MPFTLSHAAAVLPFARTKLVFSALVAGALAPEIGHFLTFSSEHAGSHSIRGLFLICVPAGFLMLLIFHKLMKDPLRALLPVSHQARLHPHSVGFRFAPASRLVLILISLLVGSITHLAWDSFTHKTGWVVKIVPALSSDILLGHHESIPAYMLLQHGSTILGLVVLATAYLTWLRKTEPKRVERASLTFGRKLLIASAMLAGACVAALLRTVSPLLSWQTFRGNVVGATIAFLSTLAVESIVFSLVWHIWRRGEERFVG